MNFLDRAIAYVFPGIGEKRLVSRLRIEQHERALQAGPPTRTSGRKSPSRLGPNAKARVDTPVTMAQARDLYRYNPYGRGVVNSIVANIVGTGIRPRPAVLLDSGDPDEAFNDGSEEKWKRWADRCDVTGRQSFYEIQASGVREEYVAGEALLAVTPVNDGREIPIMVELIAAERLDFAKDELSKAGKPKIIQGVEFADSGAIVAYWIYPNHPGEAYTREQSKRIPADRILHLYEEIEPGQARGQTRFLPTAGWYDALAEFLDRELTKARTASSFAVMIGKEASSLNFPSTGNSEDATDSSGNALANLEGGIIFHGQPGETLQVAAPSVQGSAFDPFVRLMISGMARGMDVSYELASRDLSKVTYLSARQGENQDRRLWEPRQDHVIRAFCRPVWKKFITAAVMKKAIPFTGTLEDRHFDCDWIPPGFDWIDPQKDVAADVAAMAEKLVAPQEIIRRNGRDPAQVLSDWAQWEEWKKAAGLMPPPPTIAVVPQGAEAKPGEPPPQDEDQPKEDAEVPADQGAEDATKDKAAA
jgi:lambda family phage portal protein